ncbi:MAG: cytidylate kinase family protein, partial [Oscillospiraceae bacterium]|nr:cytidylate kinase family protein [Oscillospiraceae bacterium]
CVKRIMTRGDKPTKEQARAMAEKTNKLRANFYNFYTDKTWGDAKTYDLTIDSSLMPMDLATSTMGSIVDCWAISISVMFVFLQF